MPTMIEGGYRGQVVWLGYVPEDAGLQSTALDRVDMGFHGVTGEKHSGETRPSCSRMTMLYPKGTKVRNVRQLTILSQEELDGIARDIQLDKLDPGLLGASIVLSGIPDFTHVPPSSRLVAPSGLTLTIDMENLPCVFPGREIEENAPGHGKPFKTAAKHRRGVTAWVERPGALAVGEQMILFVPSQRGWEP
ncbi:MAG: sulfurase [Aestuariivita sp.]|uniref:MOSC domain-containing protein n=1 Tax=Aestuariivita sp. TaxID=1872407 RepID=UPI003BB1FE87